MILNLRVPNAFVHASAIVNMLAGLCLIIGFAVHPAGEDATFGTNPLWVPAHGLLWIAFALAPLGWPGIYVLHAERANRVGLLAVVLVIFGSGFASWIFSSDVTFVPVIAAEAPVLFKRIFVPPHLVLGVVSVLSWVAGNVLFGISVIRARYYPRWAGLLLAVGTGFIPIAYLTGLSVRFVAAGGALAGLSQIRLGFAAIHAIGEEASAEAYQSNPAA